MNYRHAFHAGNFADVVKHAVLSRLVVYLTRKDKPFRVIDTHAGRGLYDLAGEAAGRTGEWLDGIGRLLADLPQGEARTLLAPYIGSVLAGQDAASIETYPGSPVIVRRLLRRQDRLTAIELHPEDADALSDLFSGDHQVRVIQLDGWLALGAHLPPKEKRGLVLVDPPFEEPKEFERMVGRLRQAHARWPQGIYALWYPIKDTGAVQAFRGALREAGIPRILDIALHVRPAAEPPRLHGSGLVIVNPPWTLEAELRIMLPALSRTLSAQPGSVWSLDWLAGER